MNVEQIILIQYQIINNGFFKEINKKEYNIEASFKRT